LLGDKVYFLLSLSSRYGIIKVETTPLNNVSEISNMKKTINVNIKSFSMTVKFKLSIKHLKNKDKTKESARGHGIVRAAFKLVLQTVKNVLTIPCLPTEVNYSI
jgi:hypothetical protein